MFSHESSRMEQAPRIQIQAIASNNKVETMNGDLVDLNETDIQLNNGLRTSQVGRSSGILYKCLKVSDFATQKQSPVKKAKKGDI